MISSSCPSLSKPAESLSAPVRFSSTPSQLSIPEVVPASLNAPVRAQAHAAGPSGSSAPPESAESQSKQASPGHPQASKPHAPIDAPSEERRPLSRLQQAIRIVSSSAGIAECNEALRKFDLNVTGCLHELSAGVLAADIHRDRQMIHIEALITFAGGADMPEKFEREFIGTVFFNALDIELRDQLLIKLVSRWGGTKMTPERQSFLWACTTTPELDTPARDCLRRVMIALFGYPS